MDVLVAGLPTKRSAGCSKRMGLPVFRRKPTVCDDPGTPTESYYLSDREELEQRQHELDAAREIAASVLPQVASEDVKRYGQGIQQMVWSLLTSAEFRFNH